MGELTHLITDGLSAYQIITLHTLKLHSVLYQLHLNKAGEKAYLPQSYILALWPRDFLPTLLNETIYVPQDSETLGSKNSLRGEVALCSLHTRLPC